MNAEFKTHHYSIIDAVDDQKIIKSNLPAASASTKDIQSRKLSHLGRALELVGTEIQSIPEDSDDTYLLQQYSDRLDEFKTELKAIHAELFAFGPEETDDLFNVYARLSKKIFDSCHKVKKSLGERETLANHGFKGV